MVQRCPHLIELLIDQALLTIEFLGVLRLLCAELALGNLYQLTCALIERLEGEAAELIGHVLQQCLYVLLLSTFGLFANALANCLGSVFAPHANEHSKRKTEKEFPPHRQRRVKRNPFLLRRSRICLLDI